MKRLSLLVFCLSLLAVEANAQNSTRPSLQPRLECRNYMWVEVGPSDPCDLCLTQTVIDYHERRWERRKIKYMALAKLLNQGSKAIKSIDLDFVFSDIASRKEFLRYRIHSDREIRPGQEKDIRHFVRDVKVEGGNFTPAQPDQNMLSRALEAIPPNLPVEYKGRFKNSTALVTLSIARVEYVDGTVWQNREADSTKPPIRQLDGASLVTAKR